MKVWDIVTNDYKSKRTYNSGPLVIKDKVIVGAGNCGPGSANKEGGKVAGYSPPGGCFITGHDLETGKDAFDDRDGKVLWESPRLNDIPNAFPITYMVDGKQYIAMPAGNPGLQGNSALYTAPEYGAVRGSKSSVLWVWQLP
jgi:hypothetical protein